MRNEQIRKKRNEDVEKKNESVAQILTETTITTSTIISTAKQLICLDIDTVKIKERRRIFKLTPCKIHQKKNAMKRNIKHDRIKRRVYIIYRPRNVLVKQ